MALDLTVFRRVADAFPEPILLLRPDGRVASANRAFRSTFGWPDADLAGRSFAELTTTPAAVWREYVARCAATSGLLPGTIAVRHGDDTTTACYSEGAAFRPASDSTERFALVRFTPRESAIARFVDLTKQIGDLSAEVARRRRAESAAAGALERERRVRERLIALTEASGTLVASLAPRDVLPEIGRLAERLIPADAHAVWHCNRASGEWRVVWQQHLSNSFVSAVANWGGPGGAAAPLTEPLFVENVEDVPLLAERQPAYVNEGIASLAVIPLQVNGESYGTVVAYYRQRMSIGVDDRRVATALCNFASSALAMANIYEAESTSRVAAQLAERRAEFLAKAGTALANSLDYEATLKTVAWLAVPEIADWCAVDVLGDRGELKRVAVTHVDPSKLELARALQQRYPETPHSPYGAGEAVRTARPLLMPTIPDELVAANARDAEHLELIRGLGLTSYMCVPMVVHGRALGALTFVSAESRRQYGEADLRFAEEVAARAALAVENARAYAEVREANRLKDEFLATLSHELRTPLNAVLGYARMIRAGVLPPDKQARAIEVVERNAVALNHIIEDVLDVSRIVAGKLRLTFGAVDLSVVLHDAAATVQPAAEAKGVHVETVLDPLIPPIAGDADRLQQVVWNLLSNAVKFTPRGGRVELRLDLVDSQVEIAVRDTGAGIKPEFLPYLFERFRQADSRFAREHGGLGLGLAIARHLVEMHGGTISAASDGEGKGARFTVRLPVVVAEAGATPGQARAGVEAVPLDPPHAASDQLKGLRILAVDDDPDALALVAEILESAGARVTTANSALAAIEQLQRAESPDILLTDLGMPGMDGLELMAQVRQFSRPDVRDLPAVALTAYARSEDRTRALESGYQMHLAKPVSPPELIAAIRALASRGRGVEHQV